MHTVRVGAVLHNQELMKGNSSMTEIGRRLRDAAHDAGLTLKELGDKMEVSRPTIYAYASGALKMNEKRVCQVAEITGRPVGYFEPKSMEDLDPRSNTVQSFRLIDALMSPPSPQRASEAAQDALELSLDSEAPGIRAELLRKLGQSLAQTGDYVGAIRHLEEALTTFVQEEEVQKQALCLQTLGFCYLSLGQVDRASDCFKQAKELHAPESKWKAAVALAALSERIGEFRSAESQLSELLDDPNLDETALTYVRANYSSIVCTQGRWKSGHAQSEIALNAAFAAGLTDQVLELLVQTALALTNLGRLEEATMMVVRAKDVAFTLKDEARATLAEVAQANLLFAFGDEGAARKAAGQAYSRALKGQFRRSESQSLLLLAELAHARGDSVTALEFADQTRSHGLAHQFVVTNALASILEAKVNITLGELDRAEMTLNLAEKELVNVGNGRPLVLLMEAQGLRLLAGAEVDQAFNKLSEAARLAESQELVPDAVRIYSLLIELADSLEEGFQKEQLSERMESLKEMIQGLCPDPQAWKRFLTGPTSESNVKNNAGNTQ